MFGIYSVMQIFLTDPKYMGYKLSKDNKFLNSSSFESKLQISNYIMHTLEKGDKSLDVYLFTKDSKHINSVPELTKLLDKYRTNKTVFLFVKEPLKSRLENVFNKYRNLKIKVFLHKHFIMEMNTGPLCSVHRILTVKEVEKLCFQIMKHGHDLPAISVHDPQVIWIGGEINDVVEIVRNSEITGKTIAYKIVVPIRPRLGETTGNIIKKEDNKENADAEAEEEYDDEFDDNYE